MDNNCVAIAMVTGVGLAFFLGLSASRAWQKVLAFGGALLMVHATMFSFSRGGMLALVTTGVVAAALLRASVKHYAALGIAVCCALVLAGPEVRERFVTTFTDAEYRDSSAQSRIDLWADCWDLMLKKPLLGAGPDHWPIFAGNEYGWPMFKEAHSLWFQTGAELGFVGAGLLLGFYLLTMYRLWQVTRGERAELDAWLQDVARMVIASLAGFMCAAQFVSLERLELPYYVVLLGAGALKLSSVVSSQVDANASSAQFANHPARLEPQGSWS
jgi:O-antigen ligase